MVNRIPETYQGVIIAFLLLANSCIQMDRFEAHNDYNRIYLGYLDFL